MMKGKLSLILVVVLTMSMFMGISVSADTITTPIRTVDITITTSVTRDNLGSLPNNLLSAKVGSDTIRAKTYAYTLFNSQKELVYVYMFGEGVGSWLDSEFEPITTPSAADFENINYVMAIGEIQYNGDENDFAADMIITVNGGTSLTRKDDSNPYGFSESYYDPGNSCDEPMLGILFDLSSSKPDPNPKPSPKKDVDNKQEGPATDWYGEFLKYNAKSEIANDKSAKKPSEIVDRDTFKSEAPAKTVVAADAVGAASFLDLKVHGVDEKTSVNQKFLAQNLVSPSVNILLTENIYPRRELGMVEDGAAKTLSWNNLPKDQAGPVFAVVYNETDGAYEINGVLNANGTAVFNGFKLRAASTITICK